MDEECQLWNLHMSHSEKGVAGFEKLPFVIEFLCTCMHVYLHIHHLCVQIEIDINACKCQSWSHKQGYSQDNVDKMYLGLIIDAKRMDFIVAG